MSFSWNQHKIIKYNKTYMNDSESKFTAALGDCIVFVFLIFRFNTIPENQLFKMNSSYVVFWQHRWRLRNQRTKSLKVLVWKLFIVKMAFDVKNQMFTVTPTLAEWHFSSNRLKSKMLINIDISHEAVCAPWRTTSYIMTQKWFQNKLRLVFFRSGFLWVRK